MGHGLFEFDIKEYRRMNRLIGWTLAVAFCWLGLTQAATAADAKKVVVIAGVPSHGPGEHEFNAGCKLLVKCLKEIPGIEPVLVQGGWPIDENVFKDASSVVFFMDGGSRHPMIQTRERLEIMRRLMGNGAGLACIHYAVEYPKGAVGEQLLDWLGGYYETGYSDNPHNDITVEPKKGHPITSGVGPFKANDEWYFKIRFRPGDPRVTPVLTAKNLVGHDKKTYEDAQTVGWATERKDGGRSFGFTGAHFHKNWGNDDFRKLVLNGILWTAKADIPESGVKSSVTEDELKANLDPKGK